MASAEKIKHLKLIIGALEQVGPTAYWEAPNLACGVPRGVVVELLGPARTEWFIEFLKLNSELRVFWAERAQQILPTAIHQRGVDLKRITFAMVGDDLIKPLRRVIQSQLYQAVLAPNRFTEIKEFKAFQLFTEKSNSTLFLLGSKEPSNAWPISLQLDIHRSPHQQFKVDILKQRHGKEL